jgi:deazaflavin-dependent oxidoreductase (nitroreductase family)
MPVDPSSRVGRLVTAAAGTRVFARVGPAVVPRLDRLMHRLSGGRVVLSAGMTPSLMLTTTGAKTGLRRTTPLATQPDGGSWYVVGSNFGRQSHPAWSANLIANPEAEITFKRRTIPVKAHLLTAEEKAEIWPGLLRLWPNYDVYTDRSGRDLRVFRLDPT